MDLSQLLRALGLQQAYQSYQQNIGEPFAAVVGGGARGMFGLDRPEYGGLLGQEAYRTGQAIGNMPAVSAPVGAFKAAAQVPGLLADATQAMKGLDLAGLLGLTAYHGSPYRFSKFDPTKIGSGEGAQAYGYGLYFAENPGVARSYIKTPDDWASQANVKGSAYRDAQAEMMKIERELRQKHGSNIPKNEISAFMYAEQNAEKFDPKLIERIKAVRQAEENAYKDFSAGSFYKVDLPDEMIGRMLDWDKPLGQQSETIQRLAKQVGLEMDDLGGDLVARFNAKRPEGAMLLREQGIPGIRYYDQASRTKDGGTRNFVVFPGEEEAIKMLKVE